MKRRRGSKTFCCLLSLLFLFLVSGCGEGRVPSTITKRGPAAAAEKKKGEAAKAPEQKVAEKKEEVEYTYSPAGKPDPFKPFIQLTPVKESKGPLTPLQKYEISQLKLVAIISTPEGNIGLVEDSAGKGYFLKKGTEIGKNDGKITKILNDRVIVEEVYQDVLGQTKVNEILLILHRMEEGGGS